MHHMPRDEIKYVCICDIIQRWSHFNRFLRKLTSIDLTCACIQVQFNFIKKKYFKTTFSTGAALLTRWSFIYKYERGISWSWKKIYDMIIHCMSGERLEIGFGEFRIYKLQRCYLVIIVLDFWRYKKRSVYLLFIENSFGSKIVFAISWKF